MTVHQEADRLLPWLPPTGNVGHLKPGDRNAEGTLQIVHGPYPSSDEVPNQPHEVAFYAGPGRWFAAVHVA